MGNSQQVSVYKNQENQRYYDNSERFEDSAAIRDR